MHTQDLAVLAFVVGSHAALAIRGLESSSLLQALLPLAACLLDGCEGIDLKLDLEKLLLGSFFGDVQIPSLVESQSVVAVHFSTKNTLRLFKN